jgi:hypothetical protein
MRAPDQLGPLAAIARTRRSVVAMGTLLGATAISALATGRARAQDGGDDQGGGGQGGNDQGGGGQGGNDQGGGHHGGGGEHSCLLRGTHIRTPEGNRKIDGVKIGDLVVTRSGEAKPVLWVARRRYHRKPGLPWARDIVPIRITRGALAPDSPAADLFLSDRHALYLDGVLVPVIEFLNGKTIARYPARELDEIEYLHLKLATHDVIFAEGAACDSLRAGSIDKFDNANEYEQLYGPAPMTEPPRAPILSFVGGRSELASRWRSALSPFVDRRTLLDRIRDDLEERAERMQPLPAAA